MSTTETPANPARPGPARQTGRARAGGRDSRGQAREAHDHGNPRVETHRQEDGLHVGAGLHLGAMGGDGRGRRGGARGQLAMIAHGHRNTVPATMDMMVMHGQAVRRGAPNTFMLACMPYQSYNTIDRALVNATRFMQDRCATRSSRRAANRRRIFCARWWTPASRPPPISALLRIPSPCSAASRFKAAPQMRP